LVTVDSIAYLSDCATVLSPRGMRHLQNGELSFGYWLLDWLSLHESFINVFDTLCLFDCVVLVLQSTGLTYGLD